MNINIDALSMDSIRNSLGSNVSDQQIISGLQEAIDNCDDDLVQVIKSYVGE